MFGGAIIDVEDIRSHLAKMHLGYRGAWQFQLLYTPEEHHPAYVNLFYLALGHIARLLRLPLIAVFHLARVILGGILLVAIHRFASAFLPSPKMQLTAFLLAVLGSGLGWVTLLSGTTRWLGFSPIDLWLIDGYTFLIIFALPHLALSTALLLEILRASAISFHSPHPRAFGVLVAATALLIALQPFHILILGTALGASWALQSLRIRRPHWSGLSVLGAVAVGAAPPILYGPSLLRSDPVYQGWAAQNLLPSPPPWFYLLGYAPFLPLAAAGAVVSIRRRSTRDLRLLGWLGAIPLLLYFPIGLQQRMTAGLPVLLAVLAAIGWERTLWPWIEQQNAVRSVMRRRGYSSQGLARLGLAILVAVSGLSNVYVLAGAGISVLRQDEPLFHPRWEVAAADWLGSNAAPEEIVLGSYATGSFIPARIGHRVFMGHWAETVALGEKRELAGTFFQSDTLERTRRGILQDYRIGYVFHGPKERALGGFAPQQAAYLAPAYSSAEVTIYRVDSSVAATQPSDG